MLQDPRSEICEVVRDFGERGKIFNIHFRNIRGHRDDFCETYPDDGDLDMLAVARTLKEVGYEWHFLSSQVQAAKRRLASWRGMVRRSCSLGRRLMARGS